MSRRVIHTSIYRGTSGISHLQFCNCRHNETLRNVQYFKQCIVHNYKHTYIHMYVVYVCARMCATALVPTQLNRACWLWGRGSSFAVVNYAFCWRWSISINVIETAATVLKVKPGSSYTYSWADSYRLESIYLPHRKWINVTLHFRLISSSSTKINYQIFALVSLALLLLFSDTGSIMKSVFYVISSSPSSVCRHCVCACALVKSLNIATSAHFSQHEERNYALAQFSRKNNQLFKKCFDVSSEISIETHLHKCE